MTETHYRFKRLFLTYLFGYMPFGLIAAILSLAHVLPVHFYERPYYGITWFLIALLTIPFFGLIFGILNWAYLNFGSFVYRCVVKTLKIGEKRND